MGACVFFKSDYGGDKGILLLPFAHLCVFTVIRRVLILSVLILSLKNKKMSEKSDILFGGDKGILLSYGSKQNVYTKTCFSPYFGQPLKTAENDCCFLNALGSNPLLTTKKVSSRMM
ncbi:MAG TPA: hypothetical protein DCG79_04155, partial [Clostridiales bacterium]|nr:hypothetical protein [Clostridiales bacterium]